MKDRETVKFPNRFRDRVRQIRGHPDFPYHPAYHIWKQKEAMGEEDKKWKDMTDSIWRTLYWDEPPQVWFSSDDEDWDDDV